ncbi:ribose-phosphate diphosphokinase [Gallaecimonas xiamenensis]|uniref:Ribose-phosphate pyrophosphokinase n=1 Tax=Gallaecimonas xiamenensis 3-C-1 TaxID=745411 RepID=K2JZZ9_9GAMM|nr:ribose-phosphate diphosphokinase [Gallaecimonas xiamenensis]EKE75994.1 ribose-phosphate pyrophosphokinase [Gallaecimonas xiamenensis 3-C-1]
MKVTGIDHQGQQHPLHLDSWCFSGGEEHIRFAPAPWESLRSIEVSIRLADSAAVMRLLLIKDALDRLAPRASKALLVPYFPYARQDRVCVPGEAFGVELMAKLLKGAGFDSIESWDLHSAVSQQLLGNDGVSQAQLVGEFAALTDWLQTHQAMLVAPDKGASAKIGQVAAQLHLQGIEAGVIQASKKRDPVSGQILATEVDADVAGKNLLILDDICDGGRTFIELAKVLKEKGAGSIGLYVTHGIFSKGLAPFAGLIDDIFTTDSIRNQDGLEGLVQYARFEARS